MNIDSRGGLGYIDIQWYIFVPPDGTLLLRRLHAKCKLFLEANERVNFAIMKRFEAEAIEFAFPSQMLYVKNETNAN